MALQIATDSLRVLALQIASDSLRVLALQIASDSLRVLAFPIFQFPNFTIFKNNFPIFDMLDF